MSDARGLRTVLAAALALPDPDTAAADRLPRAVADAIAGVALPRGVRSLDAAREATAGLLTAQLPALRAYGDGGLCATVSALHADVPTGSVLELVELVEQLHAPAWDACPTS